MTTYSSIWEALEARFESLGLRPDDYAWTRMLDELRDAAIDPMTIPDDVFSRFLQAHKLETGPIGPCPSWCEDEPGHKWDSIDGTSNRQLRLHSRQLGKHTDLLLEEFVNAPLFSEPISLRVYVDEPAKPWTSAEVRILAAELLNAADELDRVTNGDVQWTEDQL